MIDVASGVKWIKFDKRVLNCQEYIYTRMLGKEYELLFFKLILNSEQVENENYGYISLKIGKLLLEPTEIIEFITYDKEFSEKAIEEFEKIGLIEVQEERIKVNYPWNREPTRNSIYYHKWKNKCLERDNYTCSYCCSKDDLIVHHIIPWRVCKDDDDLRYDINNGITLCRKCHIKAHNGNWRN